MNKQLMPLVAHGLGTYRWLKADVTSEPLSIFRSQYSGFIEASVVDAGQMLQKFQINKDTLIRNFSEEQVYTYELEVDSDGFSFLLNVHDIGASIEVSTEFHCIYVILLFIPSWKRFLVSLSYIYTASRKYVQWTMKRIVPYSPLWTTVSLEL